MAEGPYLVRLVTDYSPLLIPRLTDIGAFLHREYTSDEASQWLEQMKQDPHAYLFVATPSQEPFNLVGMASLFINHLSKFKKPWIEDVVVDPAHSGHQLGQRLTQAAVDHAFSLGCGAVNLTSHPDRQAANHIYEKMGFKRIDTNYWRLYQPSIDKPE